jgi:RsiW-degrading membrane proteinase PrsW (M82 family)
VFLRLASWYDRNFDYVFDGIVYAVFCGLGFAVAENISYVFTFGPGAAVVRAFTAIPGHCVFAVFMGSFYGRTKLAQVQQRHIPRLWNGLLSLAVPIFCHGVYDTLAGIEGADAVFFVFLLMRLCSSPLLSTKHVSRRAERISDLVLTDILASYLPSQQSSLVPSLPSRWLADHATGAGREQGGRSHGRRAP